MFQKICKANKYLGLQTYPRIKQWYPEVKKIEKKLNIMNVDIHYIRNEFFPQLKHVPYLNIIFIADQYLREDNK
jgi:hypothetical protein